MSQSDRDVTPFVENPSFRDWVYNPTPETDAFWTHFLARHPDKRDDVEQSRTLLRTLQQDFEQDYPSDEQINRMYRQIRAQTANTPVRQVPVFWRWAAAACVVLCLSYVGWLMAEKPLPATHIRSHQPALTLTETHNKSAKPMLVKLPDGSSVWLQPRGRLRYSRLFGQQPRREVYLTGNAFFEVTKNPDKPFMVYTNDLITKVLGTSFWINASDRDQQVVVRVKTGKVAVIARSDSRAAEMKASRELEGVVLTPNQQLLFSRDEVRMKKSLVDQPEPIQSPTHHYQDAPVSQIFSDLETAYGVDIIYDEDVLSNCLLTASLTDEPLFQKLNLICRGIEGNYQVVDAQIVINAKGCP